jgi:hypothetical protein
VSSTIQVRRDLAAVKKYAYLFSDFDDSHPASIAANPHVSTSDYEHYDRVYVAKQDGTVVTIGGQFATGSNLFRHNAPEEYRNPAPWTTFQPLSAFHTVQIASGFDHTLVLTDTGDVFSFGLNGFVDQTLCALVCD